MSKGDIRVLEARKPIFGRRYELWDFMFLFLVELGTCLHNLIPKRGVEHWEKNYFPQGGELKFTHIRNFLTIKKAYLQNCYFENSHGENIL
jgi:hypothetical protein